MESKDNSLLKKINHIINLEYMENNFYYSYLLGYFYENEKDYSNAKKTLLQLFF